MKSKTRPTDQWIMSNPDHWSRWPLLPLVGPNGKCALALECSTPGSVYFAENANFWDDRETLEPKLAAATERTITSLLAEGWRVD